jgi:tetratricopeptide (TPR) repeat protein
MNILGYQIDPALFWTIVLGVPAVLITILAWIFPRKAKLDESTLKELEKRLGRIYLDGLGKASSPVLNPFSKGLKLMKEYKWMEAIAEFNKGIKSAQESQKVALYNLIGLCYYRHGKLDLAQQNYSTSLTLANRLKDREGEANVLGNLGLITQTKGDLNQALKYYENSLQIDREIGDKKGEVSSIINIGLIFRARGDLDKALKYHEDALKIAREIKDKEIQASALGNFGIIFATKGDLNKAQECFQE